MSESSDSGDDERPSNMFDRLLGRLRTGLIVATQSERRTALLRRLGVGFTAIPYDAAASEGELEHGAGREALLDDTLSPRDDDDADERKRNVVPQEHVQTLALVHECARSNVCRRCSRALWQRRARDVALKHHDALVVGVASVVFCQGRTFGVPRSAAQARTTLSALSGTTHSVFTALAIVHGDDFTTCVEETKVSFAAITSFELDRYVESGLALDCVGGYDIGDSFGAVLIAGIVGDPHNVMGFPLRRFYRTIKRDFKELLVDGDPESESVAPPVGDLAKSPPPAKMEKSRSFTSLFNRR